MRKRIWKALLAVPLLAPVAVSCIVPGVEEHGAVAAASAAVAGAATTDPAAGCAPGAGSSVTPASPRGAAMSDPIKRTGTQDPAATETVEKTDQEWRRELTPEQYYITRQHGTEPAFSGKYWHYDGQGVYRCVCCGQELFRSDQKYDSGTGWPSFWAPIAEGRLKLVADHSLGMDRVEVRCGRCGAHLGHLFDDGPQPTGQRYCLNSAALDFQAGQPAK